MLLVKAVTRFFELAEQAARDGGMVATRKGGTKNVMAAVITKRCTIDFNQAKAMIDLIGQAWCMQEFEDIAPKDWYVAFCKVQQGDVISKERPWEAGALMHQAFDEILEVQETAPEEYIKDIVEECSKDALKEHKDTISYIKGTQ
jgi:hypothetical protein